jgi:hypothetical protein
LARAIYGDFVDDAAGNRFYQYDMEQAKRLVKEGYALSEINKYSLKQLRGSAACHRNRRKERMPHLN